MTAGPSAETDITQLCADVSDALGLIFDEMPSINSYPMLQEALRGDINIPRGLVTVIKDFGYRTHQPANNVALGRDPDGWSVHASVLEEGNEGVLLLRLASKNVLRWRRHHAAIRLGLGDAATAGEFDSVHLRCGRKTETYRPYLTSPDYADAVLAGYPEGSAEQAEASRQLVWPHFQNAGLILEGYVFSVYGAGKAVMNAVELNS